MIDDDQSALHKLATIATDALHKAEAKIEAVMEEADAELLKGPAHLGPPSTDLLLGLPTDDFVVEPMIVDQEGKPSDEIEPIPPHPLKKE